MYLAFDDIYLNAKYDKFNIGGERAHYRINVGSYPGTAEDSLAYHDDWSLLQKTMIMTEFVTRAKNMQVKSKCKNENKKKKILSPHSLYGLQSAVCMVCVLG